MNHKAKKVENYSFNQSDQLFIDANVWLYIFGPNSPNNHKSQIYSQVFHRILSAKSNVYIEVLVISEFINRYTRMLYELASVSNTMSYKKFRGSSEFKAGARSIANSVKRIISCSNRVNNGFDVLDTDDLLNEFKNGNSDFNDQVLISLCKKEGFTLITEDRDFRKQGVSILTSNSRLLT